MSTETETLTGTLTRPVVMSATDHRTKVVTAVRTFPVGTEVYARETRDGWLSIRVCGTLFSQKVNGSTVSPA